MKILLSSSSYTYLRKWKCEIVLTPFLCFSFMFWLSIYYRFVVVVVVFAVVVVVGGVVVVVVVVVVIVVVFLFI